MYFYVGKGDEWQDRKSKRYTWIRSSNICHSLMKRSDFIQNVLEGDKEFSAGMARIDVSMYTSSFWTTYDWLTVTLTVLVAQWSEKYTACDIIIFEEQQVWDKVKDKECSLGPCWVLGSMRCSIGKRLLQKYIRKICIKWAIYSELEDLGGSLE